MSRWCQARNNRRIEDLERRAASLAEESQQALRTRDEFLSTLSHELRTPLNAMLGWVQLLKIHRHNPALRDHAMEVIERNARTQVQLIADLLDLSRLVTGRVQLVFEPIDLREVVRAVIESLSATANAREVVLVARAETLPGDIQGDAARLQQLVWNLLSNAIKFTPRGGSVTVDIRSHAGWAEIVVTDTGIGIAPELLPFVFDRFKQGDSSLTRTFGGLGIGLALVRHLTELHGGSVHVASKGRDRGASFGIRLPLRAQASYTLP